MERAACRHELHVCIGTSRMALGMGRSTVTSEMKKIIVIKNATAICASVPGEMKMISEHSRNFFSSSHTCTTQARVSHMSSAHQVCTSHQYVVASYELHSTHGEVLLHRSNRYL